MSDESKILFYSSSVSRKRFTRDDVIKVLKPSCIQLSLSGSRNPREDRMKSLNCRSEMLSSGIDKIILPHLYYTRLLFSLITSARYNHANKKRRVQSVAHLSLLEVSKEFADRAREVRSGGCAEGVAGWRAESIRKLGTVSSLATSCRRRRRRH